MHQDVPQPPPIDPETDALQLQLWDALPFFMGIVEMDEQDEVIFLHVNTLNAMAFGLPREKVPGTKGSSLADPKTMQMWRDAYKKALETRQPVEFEAYMGPGLQHFFSVTAVYLGHSAAGRPRFGFVYRNTTALRQSEELLRSILESSPSYIMALDRDYKIVSFSGPPSPEAPPMDQFIGKDVMAVAAPQNLPAMKEAFDRVLSTGQIVETENVYSRGGAIHAWFSLAVGPLRRGGEIAGVTVVSTNVTTQKRLEAELTQKNAELEREIEERRRTEELLRKKQEEILALSTPVLKVWDGVVALPIIGALDAARAAHVMETLLHAIARDRARAAILDLTGVEEVDTATASHLFRIARAAGLLGSRCVLSGISPRIAQTMVEIGVDAEGLATFRTLKDALRYAIKLSAAAPATKF